MTKNWMEAIDARSAAALASGALQPVAAEQIEMEDAGMRFIVRWVSSLAVKDAAKAATAATTTANTQAATPVAIPGGPRAPNFNPFLNPDPELTVGPIGTGHVVILNKFPLCDRHLVLARRAFEEQLLPLAHSDFAALAEIMVEASGIGLYNGGTAAGASQRHKHVQWMPDTDGNAVSARPAASLLRSAP
jgi:ATP adenylyltransferase